MTKWPWSSPCEGETGLLLLNSSSIICSAILSSSSITVAGEAVVADVDCDAAPVDAASLLSSTVMTQLESARAPARFCQTPMWDFSGSRRRQVRDGDGALQHLRSLALRIWDRLAVEEPPPMLLRASLPTAGAGSPVLLLWTGKLVLALRPLISTAASSYALAASSAVSKSDWANHAVECHWTHGQPHDIYGKTYVEKLCIRISCAFSRDSVFKSLLLHLESLALLHHPSRMYIIVGC